MKTLNRGDYLVLGPEDTRRVALLLVAAAKRGGLISEQFFTAIDRLAVVDKKRRSQPGQEAQDIRTA